VIGKKWLVFVAFDDEDAARDYARAVQQAKEVHLPALGTWQSYPADVVADVQRDLPKADGDDVSDGAGPEHLEERIVAQILSDLGDRSGFDGWWGSLDGDVQLDVIVELETSVCAILEAEGL
jgi:hypothetical protein